MMKTPRLAGLLALIKGENNTENAGNYEYDALTPSLMNEEDAQHYIHALNFACHQPDIKNIAVTGPYGAGKSSVLLTWSRYREKDLKIMTVSLADFDMIRASSEIDDKSADAGTKSDKKAKQQEKSIEYSILQQILYKARKSELPYSRIERIADVTPSQTRKMALDLLATLASGLCGLVLLFPEYYGKKLSLPEGVSESLLQIPSFIRIGLLAGGAFFITFYLVLSKLHRMGIFDRRVSIDKIDLSKGATISARPSDTSLLNVFIDEIVYFFEKQKYNVVIFEDLDRYNDGAIFIKLREINQIINNSRTADNPVRFIYALRDDIFNSPEARTKFFDFVIPVIPVMDSQNVTDHFLKKFREDEFKVSGFEQCIARLALFIPDMRVLNSIANEFRLYRNLVSNGENIIRLISLIAYKNLCSRDYHLIDSKQGILYGFINAYVSGGLTSVFEDRMTEEIHAINIQISEINDELANDKSGVIRDVLQVYISDKTQQQVYFSNQNGAKYLLEKVISDENLFLSMLKTPGLHVSTLNYGLNIASINTTVADGILNEYRRRCELLSAKSDGKITSLKKRAEQLLQQKRRLQASRPETLIQRMGSEGFRNWVRGNLGIDSGPDSSEGYTASQLEFIYSLLRWGYLSTDYMSYRSVFIPGSLTSNDNDFIRAVGAGREHSVTTTMTLEKTANVVAKLKELGLLLQDNAWHNGVLSYLLEHDRSMLKEVIQIQLEEGQEQRLERLCKQVFNSWPAAESLAYAQLMASDTKATIEFLRRLQKMSDKKSAIKMVVVLFCSSKLQWNNETTDMKEAVENIFSEYGYIPDEVPDVYADMFTENIRRTRVILSRIDECKSEPGKEIVRLIANLNLWKYSSDNALNIVKILSGYRNGIVDQFFEKPLTTSENYGISFPNGSVKQGRFIKDFFISSREYEKIEEVLNLTSVSEGLTHRIIQSMDFKIHDVSKVNNRALHLIDSEIKSSEKTIYALLLENNRLRTSWRNLEYLLNNYEDSEQVLAGWFERNYAKISDIPEALSSLDIYIKLIENIYTSEALSYAAQRKIISSIQLTLLSLPENLTLAHATLLVEYGRLAPNHSVYEQLYTAFHEEGDRAVLLLARLVLQRPLLLEKEPDFILFNNGGFSPVLARQLLTSKDLPGSILISTLQWLWRYDEALFEGPLFIDLSTLSRLLTLFRDEKILRALLVQALRAGNVAHDVISQFLGSFSDPVSRAFISDLNHRSIDMTAKELELAQLLEAAGFIRSLKKESREWRFRFVPHNSSVFRRG
ncbi:pcar [Cronobacter dublinensis]